MKAMILAAGKGSRMGELTKHCPKPLIHCNGIPLIEYHIRALASLNVTDIVINTSYLSATLIDFLGDGSQYGVDLCYSIEEEIQGTGGGILRALPLLNQDEFFYLASADIWTDYCYKDLPSEVEGDAHILLVDNPDFHPKGDYILKNDGTVGLKGKAKLTYGGLALVHPRLFDESELGYFSFSEALNPAIEKGLVTGTHHQGTWFNIGTPEQLAVAERYFQQQAKKEQVCSS